MALLDAALLLLLTWRIKPVRFIELKWPLAAAAALFWGGFAFFLVQVFWESYYRYFYPPWFHSGGILLLVALVFGLLALAFHWLALRLPGNPIVTFCLLCGLESLLEHLWGIWGLRITAVPILQAASPAAMLAFAFPEYILYWCVVILLAAASQSFWRWGRKNLFR